MSGWWRAVGWVAMIGAGLASAGLGAFFVSTGLDRADKLASVVGVFVGLGGLGLTVYGLMLTRRGMRQPAKAGWQTVATSTVGGEVLQVRGVGGSLKVGLGVDDTAFPSRAAPSSATSSPEPGSQMVTGSQVNGPIRQVDRVDGDATFGL